MPAMHAHLSVHLLAHVLQFANQSALQFAPRFANQLVLLLVIAATFVPQAVDIVTAQADCSEPSRLDAQPRAHAVHLLAIAAAAAIAAVHLPVAAVVACNLKNPDPKQSR